MFAASLWCLMKYFLQMDTQYPYSVAHTSVTLPFLEYYYKDSLPAVCLTLPSSLLKGEQCPYQPMPCLGSVYQSAIPCHLLLFFCDFFFLLIDFSFQMCLKPFLFLIHARCWSAVVAFIASRIFWDPMLPRCFVSCAFCICAPPVGSIWMSHSLGL